LKFIEEQKKKAEEDKKKGESVDGKGNGSGNADGLPGLKID
jgi:hypothetical protein